MCLMLPKSFQYSPPTKCSPFLLQHAFLIERKNVVSVFVYNCRGPFVFPAPLTWGDKLFFSLIVGTLLVILPHTLFHDMSGAYSFLAHEVIRCYGAVTIGLGYMAYKLRYIKDGRIRRLLAETYFVVYGVTTISLWKAWISNPSHHTLWALTLIALSTFATFFYGYFRFLRPIKTFQLPGAGKGNL